MTFATGAKEAAKERFYIKASNKAHTVLVPKRAVEVLMAKGPKDLVEPSSNSRRLPPA